jgi:hypothetical protein
MKKIIVIIISFVFLGACAQTTALLGPAITIGSTGNLMQAGFSYGTNMAVKQTTGKTPSEHVSSYVENKQEEKKIREEMSSYLQSHIELMRKKLNSKNKL